MSCKTPPPGGVFLSVEQFIFNGKWLCCIAQWKEKQFLE
jgi:hypothetical protein